MLQSIRISRANFWVTSHYKLSDFYTSAWQRGGSPLPMAVVRLILATVAVGILVWSLTRGENMSSPYWLIYLTNWGLVLVAAMSLSGLLVSAIALYEKLEGNKTLRSWHLTSYWRTVWNKITISLGKYATISKPKFAHIDGARTPWYIGLYWLLFNVTQTIAIAITVLYWTLIYSPNMQYSSRASFWLDVSTHGFNSVLTAVELVVARTPVCWLHVWQPLCLAVLYVVFSGVYYAAGGTNRLGNPFIYPVLDWSEPRAAGAVAGGSLAGLLLLYAALAGAARARDRLAAALLPAPARPPQHKP